MTVLAWPSYLLDRIPSDLRDRMSEEAEAEDISLQDVVRSALCAHYGADCDLRSGAYSWNSDKDTGAQKMLLRLQPDVFKAMVEQSILEERPIRAVVLSVLERHYGMEEE